MSVVKVAIWTGLLLTLVSAHLSATASPRGPKSLGYFFKEVTFADMNVIGMEELHLPNSVHQEGSHLVFVANKLVSTMSMDGSPFKIEHKDYARAENYTNYIRLGNFGIEFLFAYAKPVEVYVSGTLHCKLDFDFYGNPRRDTSLIEELLYFVTSGNRLVSYTLENVLSQACQGTLVSADVVTFMTTTHRNGLVIMGENQNIRWGAHRKSYPTIPVVWSAGVVIGSDKLLLTGYNSTTEIKYFMLLASDLSLIDVVKVPKSGTACKEVDLMSVQTIGNEDIVLSAQVFSNVNLLGISNGRIASHYGPYSLNLPQGSQEITGLVVSPQPGTWIAVGRSWMKEISVRSKEFPDN